MKTNDAEDDVSDGMAAPDFSAGQSKWRRHDAFHAADREAFDFPAVKA